MKVSVFLLSVLISWAPVFAGEPEVLKLTLLAKEINEIGHSDMPLADKKTKVRLIYSELLPMAARQDYADLPAEDLSELIRSFNGAHFSGAEDFNISEAERAFSELRSRGLASPEHVVSMQSVYIRERDFDSARRMYQDYFLVNLRSIPSDIRESSAALKGGFRYYDVSPDGERLELNSGEMGEYDGLVVYGSPNCWYSVEALKILPGDPEIGPLLQEAVFVTKDDDFAGLAKWNREKPLRFRYMYSREDWPQVDTTYAPGYHFFRKGKLACYAHGWHGADTVLAIKKCMDKAGLSGVEGRILRLGRVGKRDVRSLEEADALKAEFIGAANEMAAAGDFTPKILSRLSPGVLENLHMSVVRAYYFSGDKAWSFRLETVFKELSSRRKPSKDNVHYTYLSLHKARRFQSAKKFWGKYGKEYNLPSPPHFVKEPAAALAATRRVYAQVEDGMELMPAPGFFQGPRIVMNGHPGCHFATNAWKDIKADEALFKIFREHGLLISSRGDFESFEEFNSNEEMKFYFVYEDKDWPEVDLDNTPHFSFFQDGTLKYSFGSWPKKGNKEEFIKGLRAIGLYPKGM